MNAPGPMEQRSSTASSHFEKTTENKTFGIFLFTDLPVGGGGAGGIISQS